MTPEDYPEYCNVTPMTSSQPEQEYIISEQALREEESRLGIYPESAKRIRSRPHPAPAPSCQTCVDEMAIFCQGCPNLIAHLNGELKKSVADHDAAIERKARYELLDKLKEHTKKYRAYRKDGSIEWSSTINPNDLDAFIESLRTTTPQSEQEQPR